MNDNIDLEKDINKFKLIKMEKAVIELRHKYKMEELMTERENQKIFHDKELERIRIKSASIRRMQEQKANIDFVNSYQKDLK